MLSENKGLSLMSGAVAAKRSCSVPETSAFAMSSRHLLRFCGAAVFAVRKHSADVAAVQRCSFSASSMGMPVLFCT